MSRCITGRTTLSDRPVEDATMRVVIGTGSTPGPMIRCAAAATSANAALLNRAANTSLAPAICPTMPLG